MPRSSRSIYRSLAGASLLTLLALPAALSAQVRASERGGVWQTIDGTTIRVAYGRPAARGRTLFGGLVHWGEVWTPGANWATTLEVDHDVRLNGAVVPAGEYSVWLIPRQEGFTLNLHPDSHRFHTQRPDTTTFAVRIPVTPGVGENTERLTFDFDDIQRGGTTLRMHWGETVIPVEIRVRATLARTELSSERMAPFVGQYMVNVFGEGPEPERFPLELYAADGHIRGRAGPEDFFELIPVEDEPNVFYLGMLRDGEIFDVEHVQMTFTVEGGRATGFTVPGVGTPIWMSATRAN